MYLFVGIGNIGNEYQNTRHNVGFIVIDKIIEKYNFIESSKKKFNSQIFIGEIDNKKIIIIKPQTYVNLSGVAVLAVSTFFKIKTENIYVFHDDMDIKLGKIKYKIGGSSAGHNGIKNIDEKIGKNYHRIRIGIDKPEFKSDVLSFVLTKFNSDEFKIIEEVADKIVSNIHFLFDRKDLFLTNILSNNKMKDGLI